MHTFRNALQRRSTYQVALPPSERLMADSALLSHARSAANLSWINSHVGSTRPTLSLAADLLEGVIHSNMPSATNLNWISC